MEEDLKNVEFIIRDLKADCYNETLIKSLEHLIKSYKEQQSDIEELKQKQKELCTEYCPKQAELEKKDKIIDLMAEQLAGLTIFDIEKDEPLILGDKEDVKQYFEKEVNN